MGASYLMFPWRIYLAWEMITLDILCPFEGKKMYSFFDFYLFFPAQAFDFPKPDMTRLSWNYHDWRKTIINPWKSKKTNAAAAYFYLFYFCFCFFCLFFFRGARGWCAARRCRGGFCVTEAFSSPVYHFCKMWDMGDINTLPRYPCPHPPPISPHMGFLWLHSTCLPWSSQEGWRSIRVVEVLRPPLLW